MRFRAIDIQALIGNVGGYIGLCLGYTILQLPEYLMNSFRAIKRYLLELKNEKEKLSSSKRMTILVVKEKETASKANTDGDIGDDEQDIKMIIQWAKVNFNRIEKRFEDSQDSQEQQDSTTISKSIACFPPDTQILENYY